MSSGTCSDSTNQTRELASSYIFCILQHFANKLCNFTNFRTLFNDVVMNFTISIFSKILSIMQSVHSILLFRSLRLSTPTIFRFIKSAVDFRCLKDYLSSKSISLTFLDSLHLN